MQVYGWDSFRFILAVFRYETLSAAARVLDVNETTVSRRLAQAEERLQTKLFSRSASGLEPTDAGLLLVQHIERAEAEIDAGRNQVVGSDKLVSGGVRIAAEPLIINHLLVPKLEELMVQHPELKIDLITINNSVSVARREADIAVQLCKPEDDPRIITKRLGQLSSGVYASTHYASENKTDELPWLSCDTKNADMPIAKWLSDRTEIQGADRSRLIVNNLQTLLCCLQANLGKSVLPDVLVSEDLALTRLDSSAELPSQEVWLTYQPELREIGRIKASVAWLSDCFGHATGPA